MDSSLTRQASGTRWGESVHSTSCSVIRVSGLSQEQLQQRPSQASQGRSNPEVYWGDGAGGRSCGRRQGVTDSCLGHSQRELFASREGDPDSDAGLVREAEVQAGAREGAGGREQLREE